VLRPTIGLSGKCWERIEEMCRTGFDRGGGAVKEEETVGSVE
jgi:hypothetical protein